MLKTKNVLVRVIEDVMSAKSDVNALKENFEFCDFELERNNNKRKF